MRTPERRNARSMHEYACSIQEYAFRADASWRISDFMSPVSGLIDAVLVPKRPNSSVLRMSLIVFRLRKGPRNAPRARAGERLHTIRRARARAARASGCRLVAMLSALPVPSLHTDLRNYKSLCERGVCSSCPDVSHLKCHLQLAPLVVRRPQIARINLLLCICL